MTNHTNRAFVPVGSLCTQYTGAEVAITVPGPGRILLLSSLEVVIDHSFGTDDMLRVYLSAQPSDCVNDEHSAVISVDDSAGASPYPSSAFLEAVFEVSAAGSYTYYLNGQMVVGASALDAFVGSSIAAIFYPQ